MNANLAYHISLSRTLYLSAGFSGGVLQYRLNTEGMTFDNQFGTQGFDASLPNLEDFDDTQKTVADLSTGLSIFDTKSAWLVGFALHHFNQPQYSFLRSENNRLGVGLAIHGSWTVSLSPIQRRGVSSPSYVPFPASYVYVISPMSTPPMNLSFTT